MDLNININFRVEQQTLEAIKSVADSVSETGQLRRAKELLEAALNEPAVASYIKKMCENQESGEGVTETLPAAGTASQDATDVPDASSEAPAEPLPEKPKRVRRTKAQPAEQPPEEAPATPEEAPAPASEQSDLPFPVDDDPEQPAAIPVLPVLPLDGFRQKLDAIRDRLGLNDGQPNAALKRDFTKLARELMPYYGGDKSDMLTPANLYWYAEQLSRITLDDNNEFTRPNPAITPGLVEELKKAPY